MNQTKPNQTGAAFTKGPWRTGFNLETILGPADGLSCPPPVIAVIQGASGDKRVNQANARLIAQAPAMLEALEAVLDRCDDLHSRELMGWDSTDAELFNQARAIIARAKGDAE